MVTALILLGFDVTHAVLTITTYRPSRVSILLALVDGRLDPRASIAYSSLEQLASAMRIGVERVEVEVTKVDEAVNQIRNVIEDLAKAPPLVIDLGGGMRLLLLETLLAYLSLPEEVREHVKLVTYIEGTNRSLELSSSDVKRALARKVPILTHIEQVVLDLMESGREYRLDEIYQAVLEHGIKVTKQYVYKVLRRLESKGLILRSARGRYVKIREPVP